MDAQRHQCGPRLDSRRRKNLTLRPQLIAVGGGNEYLQIALGRVLPLFSFTSMRLTLGAAF
jgi:hypothetical protein